MLVVSRTRDFGNRVIVEMEGGPTFTVVYPGGPLAHFYVEHSKLPQNEKFLRAEFLDEAARVSGLDAVRLRAALEAHVS